jgi:hypothetical protein
MRDEACDAALGEYPSGQGCPGPIDEWRACARCTNKPEGDTSYYFAPEEGSQAKAAGMWCTWRCVNGYFADTGSEDQGCKPCTEMTAETCRPGFVHKHCSSESNEDASCSQPCDAEALGKPGGDSDETSEWVWTTYMTGEEEEEDTESLGGTRLMMNPTGGLDGRPNEGCMWRCKAGLRPKVIEDYGSGSASPLTFCVPEDT